MNTVKTICGDGRLVPGAGATEVEVARQVQSFANTCPGLEQYAIKKFGEAFEVVPKILAENSGQLATEVLSQLYAAHAKGNAGVGVNVSVSVAFDKGVCVCVCLFAFVHVCLRVNHLAFKGSLLRVRF